MKLSMRKIAPAAIAMFLIVPFFLQTTSSLAQSSSSAPESTDTSSTSTPDASAPAPSQPMAIKPQIMTQKFELFSRLLLSARHACAEKLESRVLDEWR